MTMITVTLPLDEYNDLIEDKRHVLRHIIDILNKAIEDLGKPLETDRRRWANLSPQGFIGLLTDIRSTLQSELANMPSAAKETQ